MNNIKHPACNATLGAPPDWNQETLAVSALHAAVGKFEDAGLPGVVTYWQPDEDELRALRAGGRVVLSIVGGTMPPVALTVEPGPDAAAATPARDAGEPVHQAQFRANGATGWTDIGASAAAAMKAEGYQVRTLYTAPPAKAMGEDARDAAREARAALEQPGTPPASWDEKAMALSQAVVERDFPGGKVQLASAIHCAIVEGMRFAQPATPESAHVLYVTGDSDAPVAIKDRNGEVVLAQCRRCGRAEAEL